ncbi:MAG TPA: hypothetical protein VEC15_00620, partial [Actinomycetota bacterium]|nr:hypothetical protein [Actinomycetota bacterium]
MSATDEAETSVDRSPLERLADLAAGKVAPDRADAVAAFARVFTRRLSTADVAEMPEDELAGVVVSAFDLADRRGPEDVAVRVFDPTVETEGYATPGSVLQTNAVDSPFLFDSVNLELESRGITVGRVLHPVVGIERADDGRIARVTHAKDARARESVMHFELGRRLSSAEAADLEHAIRNVLGDVRLAVRDFDAMQEAARRMIAIAEAGAPLYGEEEIADAVAFLEWLLDDNFVFLGYREYHLVDSAGGRALAIVPGSGLGILAKAEWSAYEQPVPLSTIEPNLRLRIEGGDLLIYSKTNRPSTVHRRSRMDYIGVRKVSEDGRIVGEARMVGLFTTKAYSEPAGRTPLIGSKLRRILELEDLVPGSHDYKAVVSTFESFPKDELFAASADELRANVMSLLALQEQQHVRVFVRRDLYGRGVSILVALPRDRYTADVGRRLEQLLLERFGGTSIDEHLEFAETG